MTTNDREQALRDALAVFLVARERLAMAREVHDAAASELAELLTPPADLVGDLAKELEQFRIP